MACDVQLVAPANDPCAFQSAVIGKQFVAMLYQDMAGVVPTTLATKAGIQAGLSAEDADQVFIISNLAAATVAEPTDQTLTGNDVPYGGTIVTERSRTIVGQMQYLTAADLALNNQLMASNGQLKRVWMIDDLNVVQGPYENATISVGGYIRAGAGTATPNRQSITVSHRGLAEPTIAAAPITGGIAGLVNA